jgi:hypothetical protein
MGTKNYNRLSAANMAGYREEKRKAKDEDKEKDRKRVMDVVRTGWEGCTAPRRSAWEKSGREAFNMDATSGLLRGFAALPAAGWNGPKDAPGHGQARLCPDLDSATTRRGWVAGSISSAEYEGVEG